MLTYNEKNYLISADLRALIKRVGGPYNATGPANNQAGYFLIKFFKYLNKKYKTITAAGLSRFMAINDIDARAYNDKEEGAPLDIKDIAGAIAFHYLWDEKTQRRWAAIAYPVNSVYDYITLNYLNDIGYNLHTGRPLARAFYDSHRFDFVENVAATLWVFFNYKGLTLNNYPYKDSILYNTSNILKLYGGYIKGGRVYLPLPRAGYTISAPMPAGSKRATNKVIKIITDIVIKGGFSDIDKDWARGLSYLSMVRGWGFDLYTGAGPLLEGVRKKPLKDGSTLSKIINYNLL